MTDWEVVFKLLVSAFFGGLIGFERETHGRAAGLRTHILVSTGSCLIMLTSLYLFESYNRSISADPARIAAGVVTGIGFLGAGTILRYRGSVIGLTTAASIWAVAAIGLATGIGFYFGSILTTAIVLITLFFVSKIEYVMIRKDWYRTLIIETDLHAGQLDGIRKVLSKYRAEINDMEVEKIPEKNESHLILDIKLTTNKDDDNIIIELSDIDGVNKARWE